jgi:hypothetical protein
VIRSTTRHEHEGQRGQVIVLFALLLPMMLALGGAVIAIGNWYVHGKNLQTKADASALGGGTAWSFPCATDTDSAIETQARVFAGQHVQADGTPFTSTTFNPQVGGVAGAQIHAVLNGSNYYDDDDMTAPPEWNSPQGPVCAAKILDVKLTEDNAFPLFSLIPLFPDIKRKARVRIEEAEGVRGLLPIAVRVPKPASAAAIFINEDRTSAGVFGDILAAKYLCENNSVSNLPIGLGGWTSFDPTNTQGPNNSSMCPDWASFSMPSAAGVVIALSFRPMCPDPNGDPCFDIVGSPPFQTVDELCNQTTPSGAAIVQCFYTTGSGASQTAQSGLQYLRGYDAATGDNRPELESVWLDGAAGTNCGPNPAEKGGAYFSAPVVNQCTATLHAEVDSGPVPTGDVEVRYKLVAGNTGPNDDDPPGDCGNNYNANPGNGCDLGPAWSTTVTLDPAFARHAFAIQVRYRNVNNPATLGLPPACANDFNNNCRWFFTGAGRSTNEPTDDQIFDNPVQRAFMGDIDLSGSVKWIRVVADTTTPCGTPEYGLPETGEAASVPVGGPRCFYVDVGLQGSIPDDQDEHPIAFNVSTTSQHQLLDCDPTIPQGQVADAIANGCGPWYAAHDFLQTPLCPPQNSIFDLPQPPPWQDWEPKTCVKTRPTASGNQIQQGLNMRIFGAQNNPSCPADLAPGSPGFQWGRNYWNDDNNANDTVTDPVSGLTYQTTYTEEGPAGAHGNKIPAGDPRLVTLFFTPYQSFGNQGQETYPVVGLGQFYITGWGRAGSVDDPCDDGNGVEVGAGNLPPPDLNFGNNYFVWGHFIKGVILGGAATPSGRICDTSSLQPCVPALIE